MYAQDTSFYRDIILLLINSQAYDSHMNLVLGDVVETIYVVDEDDEEEDIKVSHEAAFPFHYTCLRD